MTDQLTEVLKIAHIGLWQWEVNTNVISWDDEKFRMFGYEPNEFDLTVDNTFGVVHPDDHSLIYRSLDENLPSKDFFDYEYRGIKKNREIIYLWTSLHVYRDADGQAIRVKGITQDITQRKNLENQIVEMNNNLEQKVLERTIALEKKNKENELLVKEMHHRVKNNLQLISSMLSLQMSYVNDAESKLIFNQCISRIKSMAVIHDSLYSNDNLSEIVLSDYIKNVFDIYLQGNDNIKVQINIPDFVLPINKMVPLGLIINELISNSMKHAFPDRKEGEIAIQIETQDHFKFIYKDNGKGINTNTKSEKKSFGMDLIETLCEDLQANYSFNDADGEGMKFQFETAVI